MAQMGELNERAQKPATHSESIKCFASNLSNLLGVPREIAESASSAARGAVAYPKSAGHYKVA